jgi:uncharacterized protein
MPQRDGFIPGVPCFADTIQPDPDDAAAFYAGLFGWEFENAMPPGSPSTYLVGRIRGGDVGGRVDSRGRAEQRDVEDLHLGRERR